MKNIKPLIVFIVCLWAVVVVTYAKQVNYDGRTADGKHLAKIKLMQAATSCSSSSSSSGE